MDDFDLVISLDVGTWGSTFAYARCDRPELVDMPWKWPDVEFADVKTLTALLYPPQGKPEAYGYTALQRVVDLRPAGKSAGHHLLKQFKMALAPKNWPRNRNHEPGSDDSPVVKDGGRTFRILDLFADFIAWLKQEALEHLKNLGTPVDEDRVLWCLTVPGIWDDRAKRLMRRAAQQAGLIGPAAEDQAHLCLVLEAEAAAIYCFRTAQLRNGLDLSPGTTFMVVDAGGGTVDITTYEVAADGRLLEIGSGGGAHGSTYIDHEFQKFLQNDAGPLGAKAYKGLHDHALAEYNQLWNAFEKAKRAYHPGGNNRAITRIPLTIPIYQFLNDRHPEVLQKLKTKQGEIGYIHLDDKTMKSFFDPALQGVDAAVRDQFDKLNGQPCKYLFLVGGFNESKLLHNHINLEFSGLAEIPLVREPITAVAKGAVWYAMDQTQIAVRRSRRTYGIRVLEPFVEGVDPEESRVQRKGLEGDWCPCRFHTFVRQGEAVRFNQWVAYTVSPVEQDARSVTVGFFASEASKVRYTNEPGVERIGELRVDLPPGNNLNRRVKVTMFFGLTEITVEVEDAETGEYGTATFWF